MPSPENEHHEHHDKESNHWSVANTKKIDNVTGRRKEPNELQFTSRQSSPVRTQSQEVSSTSSNIHSDMDHRYEQEQEFKGKTSVIQKQASPRDSTSRVNEIMNNPRQLSSSKNRHHNSNSVNNNSSNHDENATNSLLMSISEKLRQDIQQIENKIDSSRKDTEQNLLNKNHSFYLKLEQGIVEIKNQHEDDSQKLHSATHKIDDMMKSMMEHFKLESDKLTQKQLELTTLQVKYG